MGSVIKARTWEYFFCCAVISAIVTLLTQIKVVAATTNAIGLAMFAGAFLFAIIQILECRADFSVMRDIPEYLIINISAYLFFAVIAMISRPLLNILGAYFDHGAAGNIIHTWLFAIHKAALYSNASFTWFESSLIFHGVMIAFICMAPLGMQGYFFYEDIGR